MAFINKQLEEVRALWNNHSIRSQKKGNSIPGIPEILHNETEVYGESLSCMRQAHVVQLV